MDKKRASGLTWDSNPLLRFSGGVHQYTMVASMAAITNVQTVHQSLWSARFLKVSARPIGDGT
jgi:hypothetical protein